MDADDARTAIPTSTPANRALLAGPGAPGHTTIYVYPPTHTELVHRLDEIVELLHQMQRQATARADATTEQGNAIMALVQVEQGDLDNLATALQTDDAGILAAITDLEAKVAAGTPLAAADLTALRSAVDATAALIPAPVTPPPPPPAV